MLHSKYLIQDDTLSNITNGIKEILQPSSSITLPEAITLLSASEYNLQNLNMPYYIEYDENIWPTILVNETLTATNTGTGATITSTSSRDIPLIFFDTELQEATDLGKTLKEIHLNTAPYIPTSAFRSCSNLKYASITASGVTGNEAFMDCYNLQEIYLSTAAIESRTFINCSNLSNVNLTFSNCQSNNININSSHFYSCSNLTNIVFNLEDNINLTFQESAFRSCSTLKSVNINAYNTNYVSISGRVFYDCENLEYFDFAHVSRISNGNYAFTNTKIKEVNAPILEYISAVNFFYKCSDLTTVSFPMLSSGVLEITSCDALTTVYAPLLSGSVEFQYCTKLSNIILASNFNLSNAYFTGCGISDILSFSHNTTIHYDCFESCTQISQAIFPFVTSIGGYAFKNCFNLEYIEFPEVQFISVSAFEGCNKLKSAIFPKLVSFGSFAGSNPQFMNCTALEEASFPIYTGIIYRSMFYNCNNLKTLTISSITEIGPEAFHRCYNLSQINGNISCSKVRWETFYNCYSLNSIDIQPTEIGDHAFYKCYNLSTIDLTNCSIIGSYAFCGCSNLSIINLINCSIIGSYAFEGCNKLNSISTNANIDFGAFNHCENLEIAYLGGSSIAPCLKQCYNLRELYLPNITYISSAIVTTYDISKSFKLSYISLPNCTSIASNAFSYTSIESLDLPNCQYIGEYAFWHCEQLKTLSITAALQISRYAFRGCNNIEIIYANSNTMTSLEGYTALPYSFDFTNLQKIVVGTTSMVSKYKNAPYWSDLAAYIVSQ